MRLALSRALVGVALVGVVVGVAGCAPSVHSVSEPISRSATSLDGETVKIPIGTILNITTGKLDPTTYKGSIAKPSIAIWTNGAKTKSAEFDPGIKPVKVGETSVTLTNTTPGVADVHFTIDVTN
ncbi:MAG TPA: hypothetical protein VGF80_03515 [Galbitalea sp.]|jgi:hypothetical protein